MRSRRLYKTKSPPSLRPIITFNDEFHGNDLLLPSTRFKQYFQPSQVQPIIDSLCSTATQSCATLLCASQIGIVRHVFILNRDSCDEWVRAAPLNNYAAYINTKLLYGHSITLSTQEHFSFPFFQFTVERYDNIQLTTQLINRKHEIINASGFKAHALQQGIDQMNGVVPLDWRRHFGNITLKTEVQEHFPKTTTIVDQYSMQLKSIFKDYPHLKHIKQEYSHLEGDKVIREVQQEAISIEGDFLERVAKHYEREMNLLLERMNMGLID